jgi:hypothetical protein
MPTRLTTKKPTFIPTEADFAIYIRFQKNTQNPQRVFYAANKLISAFEQIDKSLCSTVDGNIRPIMMLEEIEAGSLRIWLRNQLQSTDDQTIKKLDWKPIVGQYLVQAKYAIITWCNEADKEPKKEKLISLSRELQKIAEQTDVRHLPDYKAPSVAELLQGIQSISDAKEQLLEGDELEYLEKDRSVSFDMSIAWTPERLEDFVTRETVTFPAAQMILAVKKPDYLGNSKWELRFGKKTIQAKIEDKKWLEDFQERKIDVRPGDALRCMVEQEHSYGFDNELVAENYRVMKVVEVLVNQYRQTEMDL